MDFGHYNCRDYHISPHFAAISVISNVRPTLQRDESYEELMERARSPASYQPKFPLLRLPLEIRQMILSLILPRTIELRRVMTSQCRNEDGMAKLRGRDGQSQRSMRDQGINHIVWLRGSINIMLVCSQLHQECADLIYGTNSFLLFLNYTGITFRFRWLMPHGVAPSRNYPFLELMPKRYLDLVKKVIVHVDHVDSYTGMIKFNVGGRGLIHGVRKQVVRLVSALQPVNTDEYKREQLTRVFVRISTANAVIDSLNRRTSRYTTAGSSERDIIQKELQVKDIQDVLEPFGDLTGVHEAQILGAVTDDFASSLEAQMKGQGPRKTHGCCQVQMEEQDPILCVYGNDI